MTTPARSRVTRIYMAGTVTIIQMPASYQRRDISLQGQALDCTGPGASVLMAAVKWLDDRSVEIFPTNADRLLALPCRAESSIPFHHGAVNNAICLSRRTRRVCNVCRHSAAGQWSSGLCRRLDSGSLLTKSSALSLACSGLVLLACASGPSRSSYSSVRLAMAT